MTRHERSASTSLLESFRFSPVNWRTRFTAGMNFLLAIKASISALWSGLSIKARELSALRTLSSEWRRALFFALIATIIPPIIRPKIIATTITITTVVALILHSLLCLLLQLSVPTSPDYRNWSSREWPAGEEAREHLALSSREPLRSKTTPHAHAPV